LELAAQEVAVLVEALAYPEPQEQQILAAVAVVGKPLELPEGRA
jgi:hypothetical protein